MENNEILQLGLKLAAQHTPNAHYAAVVDFSRSADKHRFFLINIDNKEIEYSFFTTHGSGSGPIERAVKFSNIYGSRMSSKGLMKTKGTYVGKHGRSLKLQGLEVGVNDAVERRAIVIHRSDYCSKSYMVRNRYPGRSWGCICLDPDKADSIIDKLKGGSIVYTIG